MIAFEREIHIQLLRAFEILVVVKLVVLDNVVVEEKGFHVIWPVVAGGHVSQVEEKIYLRFIYNFLAQFLITNCLH